ncbi:thioredoxin family protein [Flavobacteriaceae bacterium M23B6Z8]
MKIVSTILLIFFSLNAVAQEWHDEFTDAKQIAQQKKQPILLVFAGSDWCAPCIKLERKVWDSSAFIEFANENLVLLKADFPRKKINQLSDELQDQNRALAEKYNPQGYFPWVVLLDENGFQKSVIIPGRKDSPQDIINKIKGKLP